MSIVQLVPIWRFTDRIVRSGFVIAWRFATSPTRTSPDLAKPTTDGVVRLPSALGITVGSPPSSTLTTEFVVPRSIPTAFGIAYASKLFCVFPNVQPAGRRKSSGLLLGIVTNLSVMLSGFDPGQPCIKTPGRAVI